MEPSGNEPNVRPEPIVRSAPAENLDLHPETAAKSDEAHAETAPAGANLTPQSFSLPPVQPPPALMGSDSAVSASDDNHAMPLIADDVDVIEMEWVNKAKEIIKQTKDDPYAQEREVERLQREYLKKRYGKEIKAAL